MRSRWVIVGALVALLSVYALGSVGESMLRSFDEDFCSRETMFRSAGLRTLPPGRTGRRGQVCSYRKGDGSSLIFPPPSERAVHRLYFAAGLLLLYAAAYITLGHADRSAKPGRLSAGEEA